MSIAPRLRTSVLAAKERLAAGREKLRARHDRGSPGIQVCQALSDLLDAVVLDLYHAALDDLGQRGPGTLEDSIALVPHGGFGRRDVAPYSDVDLMILYPPALEAQVSPLAERMLRDVFDTGLVLGHSTRTPDEACRQSRGDATIWTSLVESRLLAGDQELYERFTAQFASLTRRQWPALLAAVIKARSEERLQYGEAVHLLEPNVKRSPGGLRDIQLARWIGFGGWGHAEFDGLQLLGAMPPESARNLRESQELLFRIRNELHFHAGKATDALGRGEQLRLAELHGYRGSEGLLPVEEFMRVYFRAVNNTSHTVARFVESARPGSRWRKWLAPLVSHNVERDFRVGPSTISATRRGQAKLGQSVDEVLRLADLANLYDKEIDRGTWDVVEQHAAQLNAVVGPQTALRFLSILGQPARLGSILRLLHGTGILEKIVPAFSHARALLQFNEYHKFTVDEHCLRAVEQATALAHDKGPLGRAYGRIKDKAVLHLALLIHDLGKGLPGDHSDVGLEIAEATARRLFLSDRDRETLKFLVHKHLNMSHLAFRRDTSDEQLIVRFAVEVGSSARLRMLFVLTVADFCAVGPGVWNQWKADVLTSLYRRTMAHLGDSSSLAKSEERALESRRQLLTRFSGEPEAEWYFKQVAAIPSGYLLSTEAAQVAADLKRLHSLRAGEVWAQGRYLAEIEATEYTVATDEAIAPGIFHRLAGALTSKGLQILSADINTLADGLVLDRFVVHDPDYAGPAPASRIAEVEQALCQWLSHPDEHRPAFRRVWRATSAQAVPMLPTRVEIDNASSDRFTVVDVFAADRTGLLFVISRALFELGLSVSVAKIGTYLDQVVDVFYVADLTGKKIEDERRLEQIRQRLLDTIEAFERESLPGAVAR